MLDARHQQLPGMALPSGVGFGRHAPYAPPAPDVTGARPVLPVQRRRAHQAVAGEGAEVDGGLVVVTGVHRVPERLPGAQDAVAQRPDLGRGDATDQAVVGAQAGCDASKAPMPST